MTNDYEDIIKGLDKDKIERLLYKLGANTVIDKGSYLVTNTICHHDNADEASLKLYWYENTKMFYCFTEDGSMTIFSFLKHYYTAHDIPYDWYGDVYLVARECSNLSNFFGEYTRKYRGRAEKYKHQTKNIKLEPYSKNVLEIFEDHYPREWLEEGITTDAMDKYGIKFWGAKNKIIIPHVDKDGTLVGIRGRALNQDEVELVGKYMPIRVEKTWYSHPLSMNLYGLYQNKENIRKSGICFLYESEKSVLKSEGLERPNCALAVCGSSLNKYQVFLLLKECHVNEIVVCFDNEEKDGEEKYFKKLYKMCKKYVKYCNMSFIYDRKNLTRKKDSPIDDGEEIFEKLLETRVIVR